MGIIFNFMEKLYSDTNVLSTVYIVGSVLIFILILILIFSIRNTEKKEDKTEIIEEVDSDSNLSEETHSNEEVDAENNIKDEEIKGENKEEIDEKNIFDATTIIPLDDIKPNDEKVSKEENIDKALDNVENKEVVSVTNEEETNISSQIPDVDQFVDDIVKKTYERHEERKEVEPSEPIIEKEAEENNNELNEKEDEKHEVNLDNLKKALDGDKVDVNLKQSELKEKLDSMKNKSNEATSAEDLLDKLNKIREEK